VVGELCVVSSRLSQSAWYLKQKTLPSPVLSPRAALTGAAAQYSRWPASCARDRALYRRRDIYSRAGPALAFREIFSLAPRGGFQLKMKILCGSPLIWVALFIICNNKYFFKVFLEKLCSKFWFPARPVVAQGCHPYISFGFQRPTYPRKNHPDIFFRLAAKMTVRGLKTDALYFKRLETERFYEILTSLTRHSWLWKTTCWLKYRWTCKPP